MCTIYNYAPFKAFWLKSETSQTCLLSVFLVNITENKKAIIKKKKKESNNNGMCKDWEEETGLI